MSTIGEQFANMELMDKLAALCKRRGFVFASSEAYSGLSGFWDYGPLGVELKRNIERFWWDYMVRKRDNVVGLDSACIGPESVWTASGHVGAFNDALVDDKNTKERFRIDQLLYESEEDGEKAELYALNWLASGVGDRKCEAKQGLQGWGDKWLIVLGDNTTDVLRVDGTAQAFDNKDAADAEIRILKGKIDTSFWDGLKGQLGYYPKNPNTGKDSRFTVPRQFNLMFKQHIGATGEGGQTGYLPSETC